MLDHHHQRLHLVQVYQDQAFLDQALQGQVVVLFLVVLFLVVLFLEDLFLEVQVLQPRMIMKKSMKEATALESAGHHRDLLPEVHHQPAQDQPMVVWQHLAGNSLTMELTSGSMMQEQLPRHLELQQGQDLSEQGLVLVQLILICQGLEQEVRLERLQAHTTVAGNYSLMEVTGEDKKPTHLTHLVLDLEGAPQEDPLTNKLVFLHKIIPRVHLFGFFTLCFYSSKRKKVQLQLNFSS